MTPTLMYLLFAYGIVFGFQNKVPFLRGKFRLLDALLKCTYCCGFHAGWLAWLAYYFSESPSLGATGISLSILIWGLSSAAFSYALDTGVRWLEYRPE